MSRIGILMVFGLLTSAAFAQQEPPDYSGEVYALASAAGGGSHLEGASAAGFCIGGVWKPAPRLALVADFGRHFLSDTHLSANTLMIGPRIYSREQYRTSGFVQILTGAENSSLAGQPTSWSYMLAPGAGVDIRLTDKFVWRAAQIDLTLGRGPGLLRASSGFAFRFGR